MLLHCFIGRVLNYCFVALHKNNTMTNDITSRNSLVIQVLPVTEAIN